MQCRETAVADILSSTRAASKAFVLSFTDRAAQVVRDDYLHAAATVAQRPLVGADHGFGGSVSGGSADPVRKSASKWLFSAGRVAFYSRTAGSLKSESVAFLHRILHRFAGVINRQGYPKFPLRSEG